MILRQGSVLVMSLIFCILMFGHRDPGRTVPPRASQRLEVANNLPTCQMQINQSRAYTLFPLWGSYTQAALLPYSPQGQAPDN